MRAEQIKIQIDIDRVELSEKPLLVEDLWDSIAASNSELPMLEWQKEELNRRYKEYQKGSLELHDRQSVHEELREKHKT
ncbi:MAG: addiction module protein [Chlorobaculum sp.]|jgi:putative addiction module component (TIGR02574 family)